LLEEVNHIIKQCKFTYIKQQQMQGLGHAIYTGKALMNQWLGKNGQHFLGNGFSGR
jgi:UTP-glucose-1-phosphate uridylyltransferase